jgi:hypothetical protein
MGTPTIVLLCPHNVLCSVIAAAPFNQRADGRIYAWPLMRGVG